MLVEYSKNIISTSFLVQNFSFLFPFFNLILPQKNNINAVICRQLNLKIFKKFLLNAIKE